jgi:SAM-dependent methyltransferase
MGPELENEHRKLIPEAVRPRISFMKHDFFTEQPVKDADVYFFRCTLHNWPDDFVVKALRQLVPALKPGARVVIQDNGLADPGTIGLSDEFIQRCVASFRATNILCDLLLRCSGHEYYEC